MGQLDLKTLKIKPVNIDIDLFYNDDFKSVHVTIKERLSKENDKGIVLCMVCREQEKQLISVI